LSPRNDRIGDPNARLDELWDHTRHESTPTVARPELESLRALLPFLKPYRGMMVAALGALLVATWPCWRCPLALRQLIDHSCGQGLASLNGYLFGFLAASVIFGVFAARALSVTWLGERVSRTCVRPSTGEWCARTDVLETTRVGEVPVATDHDTTLVQAISGSIYRSFYGLT